MLGIKTLCANPDLDPDPHEPKMLDLEKGKIYFCKTFSERISVKNYSIILLGAEHAYQGPGMPGRHPEMHGGVEPGGVRQSPLTEQPLLRPQGALHISTYRCQCCYPRTKFFLKFTMEPYGFLTCF
jgi:hypothetical protein